MSRISQLFDLQELDSHIQSRDSLLLEVEAGLGETEELLEARERVVQARARIDDLRREQREKEYEVEDARSKVTPLEEKLYGGSIRNPKELIPLQAEVNTFKGQQQAAEDALLVVMEALEAAQEGLSQGAEALKQVESEWEKQQEELRQRQAVLNSELSELRVRRGVLRSPINPEDVGIYESLLTNKGGRAVVKVERGMCQGCRITIPTSVLQRARSGAQVVQCSSCERILYVG